MKERRKSNTIDYFATKKAAQEYAETYDQYGRFRIVQDRRTGMWKCFGYEWGQHPYSS